MGKLFAPEGTFMECLTKATNLVVINLLWLLCCVPVITVGAATTAMHAMVLQIDDGGAGDMCRGYFRAFRSSFLQAVSVWAGLLLFAVLVLAELFYYIHGPKEGKWVLLLPMVINLFILFTAVYIFPVLAYFQDNLITAIKRAAFLSVAHLPYTICILVISVLPIGFLWLFAGFMKIASYIMLVIGFALCAWMKSWFFKKMFRVQK